MLSEISFFNSCKKYDVYIIGLNDDIMLTTIPKTSNESIYTEPNTELILSSSSKYCVYTFKVNLIKIKHINNTYFYEFKIINSNYSDNCRSESRKNVEFPAVYRNKEETKMKFAKVIDVSENGLKIETDNDIFDNIVDISFKQNSDVETKRLQITWKKQNKGIFYYGLKSVS